MDLEKDYCEKYANGEYSLIDIAYFKRCAVATASRAVRAAGYEIRGAGRRKVFIPEELLERYSRRELTMTQASELCGVSISAFWKHYHEWKTGNGG